MRIAEISTAASQCGISTYTELLAEAMIGLGHEVKVFGEKRGDAPYRVPYEICYQREDPKSYANLVNKLNEWRPDVVHIQYEYALHVNDGLLLELAQRRPHFLTWHNVIPDMKSVFYGRLADGAIVHNQASLQALSSLGLGNMTVIPHGTRKNKITPTAEAKAKVGIDPKRKVIAVYGFIVPRKGYHIILNSLTQMQQFCPEAYFLIIGGHHPDGAHVTANYVDLFNVAEERYPDDIKVTGFMSNEEETDLYLSASDMVVFPHLGGDEIISASGSVRRTIDHAKLTATADIQFYSDFPATSVLKIPRTESVLTIGRWFGRQLASTYTPEADELTHNLKIQAEESYWPKIARAHVNTFLGFLSK
jgi:glycosyltransferase involved in cell wall biosynthesis